MTILEKVEILRTENKFLKKEIADIANITPATYTKIITGQGCPSYSTFYKLGKMVGATDDKIKKEHEKIKLRFKIKKSQTTPTEQEKELLKVGKCLRKERIKANLTQSELSAKMGIDTRLISKIETGTPHRMSHIKLMNLAKQAFECLGIPFDEVYKEDDPTEEQMTLINDKPIQDLQKAILEVTKTISDSLSMLNDVINKTITKEN